MTEGWVKFHRKMVEWEWYNDLPAFKLFTHLILTANHQPQKWRGRTVKAGQLITGRKSLSKKTGLTEQQIRTALDKLKSTNEITIKTTNRNTLISICNWETYQIINQQNNHLNNQQTTNKQPTNNQQITTNKNVKNENNEKNEKNSFGPGIFEDKIFLEQLLMKWRVSESQLKNMIEAFDLHLAAGKTNHPDLNAYRSHFHNWGAMKYTDYQKDPNKKEMNF